MKNIQNIIIAVLSLAVIGLYIVQFSGNNTSSPEATATEELTKTDEEIKEKNRTIEPQVLAENPASSNKKVYWVNIEKLQNGYAFYDEMQNIGNKLQRKHEKTITEKKMKAQKDYENLVKLDQKGMLTPETAQIRQEKLLKQQDEIQQLEQKAGRELAQKTEELNNQLYNNLSNYLKEYCKEIDCSYILGYSVGNPLVLYVDESLDVTDDVLEGLNKAYKGN